MKILSDGVVIAKISLGERARSGSLMKIRTIKDDWDNGPYTSPLVIVMTYSVSNSWVIERRLVVFIDDHCSKCFRRYRHFHHVPRDCRGREAMSLHHLTLQTEYRLGFLLADSNL